MSKHMAKNHVLPQARSRQTPVPKVNVADRGLDASSPKILAQPVSTIVAYVKLASHPKYRGPIHALRPVLLGPAMLIFDARLHLCTAMPQLPLQM